MDAEWIGETLDHGSTKCVQHICRHRQIEDFLINQLKASGFVRLCPKVSSKVYGRSDTSIRRPIIRTGIARDDFASRYSDADFQVTFPF